MIAAAFPEIRLLPAAVVNQIAAGEVVERPGSVVKELLENAIDAGATRVSVEAEEGGRHRLRIVDDGHGIAAEQLPLAVTAHATSKIRSAEELFRVGTLGFRGEALASVAGVSELTVRSRPAGADAGAELTVVHGVPGQVKACACPVGTQIEVRDLFASVPVRRKFLKTRATEMGHVTEAVTRLALAHPGVGVALSHNGKPVHEIAAGADRTETIATLFGRPVAEALLPVTGEKHGCRVSGLVGDPALNRPNSRGQYLFVNGRFVRDRSLQHAIVEAYRGLIMTGRYPVAYLFLEVPPDEVDVNVHPTKIEVRFEHPNRLFSLILGAIRDRFLSADLSARLTAPLHHRSPEPPQQPDAGERRDRINELFRLRSPEPPPRPLPWRERPADAAADTRNGQERQRLVDPESATEPPSPPPQTHADARKPSGPSAGRPAGPAADPRKEVAQADASAASRLTGTLPPSPPEPSAAPVKAIQLHNSYLVVETAEGMLVIDQHALHERILFEKLRGRIAASAVEVQELLVPEPVELSPTQAGLVLEHRRTLGALGLRIGEFGARCVLVQGMPTLLGRADPAALVRDIADRLEERDLPPTRDELLEDLLALCACKAAVKAGDPLTPPEIDDLVRQRDLAHDSHHCPHGRPTVLNYSLHELERQFKR